MLKSSIGLLKIGEAVLPKVAIPSLTFPTLLPQTHSQNSLQQKLRELADQLIDRPRIPFFNNNGILLAVPKKKTSHMKRRLRLYTPGSKQIKLKNELNRCPACGHYKRAHYLCMNCVSQIEKYWKQRDAKLQPEEYHEDFSNPLDEQVLYPGKTERLYERKLRKKDYLVQRPKTLPVE